MHRPRHAVAAAATSLSLAAGVLVAGAAPASSYPKSIEVTQSGTRVIESKYYREYRNDRTVLDSDYDAGRLRVEATPYRITEGMKNHDLWLLNLKVSAKRKRGGSALAWANIYVEPRKYGSISDSGATRKRTLASCDPMEINLNLHFWIISVSKSLGKLYGCQKAEVRLTSHSQTTGATGWKLRKLKRLERVGIELYIQVPSGKEPDFRVTVTTPIDSCTDDPGIPPNQCIPRDYDTTTTFRVNGQT